MIEQVGRAHREGWGLGAADSWNVDQTTGTIRWSFEDKTAEAPAQILGSHNAGTGTWLWAWANESVLPPMRSDVERVREWGEANGQASLTRAKCEADESDALALAAIAFRLTEAAGFYRAHAGASTTFLTFGPVTITTAQGHSTTFRITLGS